MLFPRLTGGAYGLDPHPGITLGPDGRFFIDKRYRGIRIGMRVGAASQERAEQRLRSEMEQVGLDLALRAHPRPRFADCAARYLTQSQDMRSLEAIRVHVRLLIKHIGHLEPQQVHDATLAPFISARIADGASATTINRTGGRAYDLASRGRARTATRTAALGWMRCHR